MFALHSYKGRLQKISSLNRISASHNSDSSLKSTASAWKSMVGRFQVARRVVTNAGNIGLRRIHSQADYSAAFGAMKFAKLLVPSVVVFCVVASILREDSVKDSVAELLCKKIKGSVPYVFLAKGEDKYIHRPAIEAEIEAIISRTEATGSYSVIYGGYCVGKSTLIDTVVQGRKGILKITIINALTTDLCEEVVISQMAHATGTSKLNPTLQDFEEALSKAVSDKGVLPTVIFEVETDNDKERIGINVARNLAIKFASVCNCIIVVSEPYAIIELDRFPDCEFLYVDELNESEMREYITRKGLTLNDIEIKKIMDNIGLNPMQLNNLVEHMSKGHSLDDFIVKILRRAEFHLRQFDHKKILQALKDHPEGVSPKFFQAMKNNGVNLRSPKEVSVGQDNHRTIIYRIELDKYTMISKSLEVALRSNDLKKWL